MNLQLQTLLQANDISYEEIAVLLGFEKGQLNRYTASDDLLYKFKLITRLAKAGLIIPYHHRPQCRTCKARYIPHSHRQYYCSECGNRKGYDLSPSDCLELGMSPEKAATLLGLPPIPEVFCILSSWTEDREEESIQLLRDLETGAKSPKKKIYLNHGSNTSRTHKD